MDLSVEEFCVQAAGKVKGKLTFQGYAVRLDPNLSVCRQLHNRWLNATGREMSYEEFKRSLRFSTKNGSVAVRMANDHTKLAAAGFAGLAATAGAVGAYQWWKSQKSEEGSKLCVKPDYEKWENGVPAKQLKSLNDDVEENYSYMTSDVPIRQILLDGVLITDEHRLREIENAWSKRDVWAKKMQIKSLTFQTGGIHYRSYNNMPSLSRPHDWVTSEELQINGEEKTGDPQILERIDLSLKSDLDIGQQITQALDDGFSRVGGMLKDETDLFLVKSLIKSKYTIPEDNEAIHVRFLNPSGLENIAFVYIPFITVQKQKYLLSELLFSDGEDTYSAQSFDGHWTLYKMKGGMPSGDWAKKIPDDNLSNLCLIPSEVRYTKEGVDAYDS
jgi:hypothetical protein